MEEKVDYVSDLYCDSNESLGIVFPIEPLEPSKEINVYRMLKPDLIVLRDKIDLYCHEVISDFILEFY